MLIDCGIGEEAKAGFMARCHHDSVVVRRGGTAQHKRSLNAGTGRSASHDAASIEEFEYLLQCTRSQIRIGQSPLSATLRGFEPDSRGLFERRYERLRIRHGPVGRMQDCAVRRTEGLR